MTGACADDASMGRAALRRRRLLSAARKLFLENGFHATGMAQLARESGIAVGQIYRDFASKEDIVAALVQEDCHGFLQSDALRLAIARGDEQEVRLWLRRFVTPSDELARQDQLFAEIVAESSRNARIAAILNGMTGDLRCAILAAIGMLAPGERLAARRSVLADAVITISLGLLHHRLVRSTLAVAPLAQAVQSILEKEVDALMLEAGTQGVGAPATGAGCEADQGSRGGA